MGNLWSKSKGTSGAGSATASASSKGSKDKTQLQGEGTSVDTQKASQSEKTENKRNIPAAKNSEIRDIEKKDVTADSTQIPTTQSG